MRRAFGKARVSILLLGCAAAEGCGSRSGSEPDALPPEPGPMVDRAAGSGTGGVIVRGIAGSPGTGGRPPQGGAPDGPRDASIAPMDVPSPPHEGSLTEPDASDAADTGTDAPQDAARDVRDEDVLTAPDCSCTSQDLYLAATLKGSTVILRAPNPLGIYCTETSVQLGHPPCSNVYRLSACYGVNSAPPCVYLAVDGARLLLGTFVDASGAAFDVIDGAIEPDPSTGRVATGSFTATIRPRAGGDTETLSGVYRACATRFPGC